MNKKVVAIACLGLCAGFAHAQSVTLFGLLDAGLTRTTAAGNGSLVQLNTDGNTSSRLGFRGSEDLGGGMRASFWLEAAVAPDSGVSGSTSLNNVGSVSGNGGLNFGRRSTIELAGSFGEVRLGRDYTPTFTNLTVSYHPFGTNGVGNAGQLYYPVAAGGTTPRTQVRASNAINYFTPKMGGFQANVMYAMGEQLSTAGATSSDGNYLGGRVSYGAGPFSIAAATGKTRYATGDYVQSNFAANYKVGTAKLMYLWGENKVGVTKTSAHTLGAQVGVAGSGEFRVAYTMLKATGVANDANQFSVGYVHNMSRRTALYATGSVVNNKGVGNRFTVGGGQAVVSAGGNSTGFDVGIRHSF